MAAAWTPASPTTEGNQLPWAWQDASAETGYSDGDPLTPFTDQSGNGNSPAQVTTSKKPTYKTGIQNGLSGVLGDGTDDFLIDTAGVSLDTTQHLSNFMVVDLTDDGKLLGFTEGSNASNKCWELDLVGNKLYLRYGDGNGGNSDTSIIGTGNLQSTSILTIIRDGTSCDVRVDGSGVGSPTLSPYYDECDKYVLMARSSGADPAGGYYFEVLVYDEALSDTDRDDSESYLATKWGISI